MKLNFNKVIKVIENGNKFAIFIHISPDGDAVGSGMALAELIKSRKKVAYLCCDDTTNFSGDFLNPILEIDESKINECDTYFFLDMSADYRSGKYQKYACKSKNKKVVVIDHHIPQTQFGDIVVRDPLKSSTSEIIYELYKESQTKITPEVATQLYTGIASDTGCFVHQNTTPSCHLAAADLINLGADIKLANYELFSKRPDGYMTIVRYAIKNMKIFGNKLTMLVIPQKQYKKLNYPDSFYFVDALTHYTTDILIIITEKEKNKIKLNMRSRTANVQKLCEKFGGGGHTNAAGAELNDSLSHVVKRIKDEIL